MKNQAHDAIEQLIAYFTQKYPAEGEAITKLANAMNAFVSANEQIASRQIQELSAQLQVVSDQLEATTMELSACAVNQEESDGHVALLTSELNLSRTATKNDVRNINKLLRDYSTVKIDNVGFKARAEGFLAQYRNKSLNELMTAKRGRETKSEKIRTYFGRELPKLPRHVEEIYLLDKLIA